MLAGELVNIRWERFVALQPIQCICFSTYSNNKLFVVIIKPTF